MKISIVGSGNVAWHLAMAFEEAGHWIGEVYSRNPENGAKLVSQLYDTDLIDSLNFSDSQADLILLAVTDHALEEVMQQIVLPENVILANTSGTTTLAELQNLVDIYSDVAVQTGILYPLQSFTKEIPLDYEEIPFCVESRDADTETILLDLARTVSHHVRTMNSFERLVYHVAAVFASNFTTQLLALSHDLIQNESLDFQLLKPLIGASIQKAIEAPNLHDALTGPAKRGDYETINKHLEYLDELDPDYTQIYRLITQNIQKRHTTNS
ncbi:Rossmann-like and DUF2520 domain-containing protein [Dyadobacter jejuensis]|nr:Rossmann-like and DUF2520 domain-containing protein [Dyadobacter jejuensis]